MDFRTDDERHKIVDSTLPAPESGEAVRFGTAETTGDVEATAQLETASLGQRHVVTERHLAYTDLHHEVDDVEGSPDSIEIVDLRIAPTQELRSPTWEYLGGGTVFDLGDDETTVVTFVHDETDEPVFQVTADDPPLPAVGETVQFGDVETSGDPDGFVTLETKSVDTVYRIGERNYAHLRIVHDGETVDHRWITAVEVRLTPANVE